MLDDEDGVAEVSQSRERMQQPVVVAGVEPNGRLIQHVENAAEAGTDLRGQADALGFTAGKRGRRTIQAEIAESHRQEKIQPLSDLFERARSDFALARGELLENQVHGRPRRAQRQCGEIRDGIPAELHGKALRPQPPSLAGGAERGGHVLRHPFAVVVRVRFLKIALEQGKNSREPEFLLAFSSPAPGFSGILPIPPPLRRRIPVEKQALDF